MTIDNSILYLLHLQMNALRPTVLCQSQAVTSLDDFRDFRSFVFSLSPRRRRHVFGFVEDFVEQRRDRDVGNVSCCLDMDIVGSLQQIFVFRVDAIDDVWRCHDVPKVSPSRHFLAFDVDHHSGC